MVSGHLRATVGSVAAELPEFVEEIFAPFQRTEQRRWARTYLRGLLAVRGKKTLRSLARAERLGPGAVSGLRQFVHASGWDWRPVRRRLAAHVVAHATPYAWTVVETVIPKHGQHSVGVHHGTFGPAARAVNGQHAVGLFLATDAGCFPVDWSLVLTEAWVGDAQRRRRARIPDDAPARFVEAHVLEHADDVAGQPLPDVPWILDLTKWDGAGGVLAGLARRRLDLLCEIGPDQVVVTRGPVPTAITAGELLEQWHDRQPRATPRRTADGRPGGAHVYAPAGRVRLPMLATDTGARAPSYRILETVSPDPQRPPRYWITSLTESRVDDVLGLVRGRAAALAAVDTLLEDLGGRDFEGRSFPGWHHHMTLVSAAYAYANLHGRCHRLPGTGSGAAALFAERAS